MNKKKYIIAAGTVLAAALALTLTFACVGGGDKSSEGGPAEAVTTFYSHLLAGQWDEAGALCGGEAAERYVGAFRQEWENGMKADSSVWSAAVGMIGAPEIVQTMKGKEGRYFVEYMISSADSEKAKTAEVKKIGEIWKIEKIRDTKEE